MESITAYLVSIMPSEVVAAGLGAMFGGLLLADRLLTKESRSGLFSALFSGDGSASRVILTTTLSAFDRLFDVRVQHCGPVLFYRPNLVRTALFSVAIFFGSVLVFSDILAPTVSSIERSVHFFGWQFGSLLILALLVSVTVNVLFDFASYTETRTLYRLAQDGRARGIMIALVIDLIATLAISYASLFLISALLMALPGSTEIYLLDYDAFAPLNGSEGWMVLQALLDTTNRVFVGIFTSPMSEWTAQDRMRFAFLMTTIGASFALWGPSLLALATTYLDQFRWVSKLSRTFVLESAPLTTAGIILFAPLILVTSVGWRAAANFTLAVEERPSRDLQNQATDAIGAILTPSEEIAPHRPAPIEFPIYFAWGEVRLTEHAHQVILIAHDQMEHCRDTLNVEISSAMNPEYSPYQNGIVIAGYAATIMRHLEASPRAPDSVRIIAINDGPMLSVPIQTPTGVREPLNRRSEVRIICED